MTFAAHMRLGSIEILAVLVAFALLTWRVRPGARRGGESFAPLRIELELTERGSVRRIDGLCPLAIGRSSQADVVLSDPEVSRNHARLESENGVVYVTDLHSSNGTFLNGKRIENSIEVRAGDHVDVGATRIAIVEIRATWT